MFEDISSSIFIYMSLRFKKYRRLVIAFGNRTLCPSPQPLESSFFHDSFATTNTTSSRICASGGNSRVENACFLESFQPGIYLRFAPDRWESCFQIRTKLQKDSAAAKTTTEERSSKYVFIKLKLKLLKTPQLRRYFD